MFTLLEMLLALQEPIEDFGAYNIEVLPFWIFLCKLIFFAEGSHHFLLSNAVEMPTRFSLKTNKNNISFMCYNRESGRCNFFAQEEIPSVDKFMCP
jgi:hypothetical protein